jgi:hypothetical protein
MPQAALMNVINMNKLSCGRAVFIKDFNQTLLTNLVEATKCQAYSIKK